MSERHEVKRARLSIVVNPAAEPDASQYILERFEKLGRIHSGPREIARSLLLADEGLPEGFEKVLYEAEIAVADISARHAENE